MSEDSIKTAEEQLHTLITEASTVLVKLKKTLNIFLAVAIPIIVIFFISFVDVRSRMAALEVSKLSVTDATIKFKEVDDKYASKPSVIFFMNDMYDMNKMFFSYRPNIEESKMELTYTSALKQFNGDVSRGTEKIINK